MFNIGEIIDRKYEVLSICSNLGGMGTILFVRPLNQKFPYPVVLKYCKDASENAKARFSREVRYLSSFSGNSLVLQVLDSNLAMDPPYFVMKFFPQGDSSTLAGRLQNEASFQEIIFNKFLDCIAELHAKGIQHRDIKPQNFLVEGDTIVVSDLGLAKEIGAGTTFTMSHEFWGTQGYLPPEFLHGSFATSTPPSDIFMLGKTFYFLITGRDPIYLTDHGIHPALYHVIGRCCDMKAENRYSSISLLRQDLKLAYDVVLERANKVDAGRQALSQIINLLETENKYDVDQCNEFLDLHAKLPANERYSLTEDLPTNFFYVLAQKPLESKLENFLDQYEKFTETAVTTWSYAETIAYHMKILFDASNNNNHRAKALEIAIEGAEWANRFAAMDKCVAMITSVADNALAIAVSAVITKHQVSFITSIEPSRCSNDIIKNAIRAIQSKK